jgi:hypothetical protein
MKALFAGISIPFLPTSNTHAYYNADPRNSF